MLLMIWGREELGHQHKSYWSSILRISYPRRWISQAEFATLPGNHLDAFHPNQAIVLHMTIGSPKLSMISQFSDEFYWYNQGETVPGYRQISNISRTSVCYKLADRSDVVGASPVGAAPTTSSFST